MKGLRVVRGPDWKWENDDGGSGNVGTVLDVDDDEQLVTVLWDNGDNKSYRIGLDNAFDLHVLDNAQIGVVHSTVVCDECDEEGIKGIRWVCAVCVNYDLCSSCYHNDKHDLSHYFLRMDTNCGKRTIIPPRLASQNQKRCSRGIFETAIVTRGLHWTWNDEDKGEKDCGFVVNIDDWHTTYRSKAQVIWANKTTLNYRLGHFGAMDLKCTQASDGGYYYENHLPVLGKMELSVECSTDSTPCLVSPIDVHQHFEVSMCITYDLEGIISTLKHFEMQDEASIKPGVRVVRGPDWKWGNQDGGEGYVGTVSEIKTLESVASVIWDNGSTNIYRIGQENAFDLRVLDYAPSGVIHTNSGCDSCRCLSIKGIRWKCTSCNNYDLCSSCYNSDKHDINHTFWRYISSNDSSRIQVPRRWNSFKILSKGIFADAVVCRGPDWEWGVQDVTETTSVSENTQVKVPVVKEIDTVLLKRKISYTFINTIQPLDILYVFHKYNLNILTEREIEDIKVETTFKGKFAGAEMLLDKLYKYNDWFICLVNVLRDEKVKLKDFADILEKHRDELLSDSKCQTTTIQENHKQKECKNYGRVLSIKPWVRSLTGPSNCAAHVEWTNKKQYLYRVGYMGKVDLTFITAAPGGYYYRDHLPLLGKRKISDCGSQVENVASCHNVDLTDNLEATFGLLKVTDFVSQFDEESTDESD